VGIVAIPSLQLQIVPKIPTPHLLHLLQAAEILPRLATGEGLMQQDENLAVLISHWFITALERVLEEGLARDYRQHRDELQAIRGRVIPLDTARLYYRGRLTVLAEYEEYDFDTPLNRLLLHVARIVAGGVALPASLRRRAARASKRIDGVGPFQRSDAAAAHTDRRTANYADALSLARQILSATGRTLNSGQRRSWTFLLRTPNPVEVGMRSLIAAHLKPDVSVSKGSLSLGDSGLTINPDLVFRDPQLRAVGDVKYKLAGAEWDRADLYEIVAFATGYHVNRSVVALFASPNASPLCRVAIGDQVVTPVHWPADPGLSPHAAANILGEAVREWFHERRLDNVAAIA
jgi:5-methylcytosine-specific restriction endonuclease McrBC regulatory subunit McrC